MPGSSHRAGVQKRLHLTGDVDSLRHSRSMAFRQGSHPRERMDRTIYSWIGTGAQDHIVCPNIYRCGIRDGSPLQDSGGNNKDHNARLAEQASGHAFLPSERMPDHRTRHHGILLAKQHIQHSKRRNIEPVGAFSAAQAGGIHRFPLFEGILVLEQLKH